MTRPKPLIDEAKHFVRFHLGRGAFGPFTGQDWPAWCAFVHLVQCYAHGGGDVAIEAMHATVRCAQDHSAILLPFVQAIPAVMDWSHVAEIWPRVIAGRSAAVLLGMGRRGDIGPALTGELAAAYFDQRTDRLITSKMHLLKAVERDRTGSIVRAYGAAG